MKNCSISAQLNFLLAVSLCGLILVAVQAFRTNSELAGINLEIAGSALPAARDAATLRGDVNDVRVSVLYHQLFSTPAEYDHEEFWLNKKLNLATVTASRLVTELETDGERQAYASFENGWEPLKATAEDIVVKSRAGEKALAFQEDRQTLTPEFDVVNGSIATLVMLTSERARAKGALSTALRQQTMVVIGVTVGLLMLLTLGTGILIRRKITRGIASVIVPMRQFAAGDLTADIPHRGQGTEIGLIADAVQVFKLGLEERNRLEMEAKGIHAQMDLRLKNSEGAFARSGAEQKDIVESLASGLVRLAAGDLTVQMEAQVSSTYAQLKGDFNRAVADLAGALRTVAQSAAAILSGTSEISSAADDLSKRTEQQAASLQETASALDEITSTVKKTAEGARHARQVVSTTKADAQQSGEIVGQAVEAMAAIEASSKQVSQIIGVIDEIAFQTNLLALNAGVEAARAGDAGRGFAVVASEVRALAQRSAEAAKEIKALFVTSTQQVSQGVVLIGQTGQSLDRIMGQVAEINTIITEIAASAQEQASGLEQVNSAVSQMDQVTQQNAAMVEESTAASHSLSDETHKLSSLIDRFQLDNKETGHGSGGARERPEPAADARRVRQRVALA